MKTKIRQLFFLGLILLNSCKDKETELFNIDPSTFTENGINLSEISDDIKYIPIDNRVDIGLYSRCKIVNNYIYLAVNGVGVCRYTMEGKFDKQYGKIGRGPGEFVYWLKYAVDKNSGTLYVLDEIMDDIEVYNNKGTHIREIKLTEDKYGFGMRDIEIFNSHLVIAQYINMGRGEFNWIIADTLGNKKWVRKNPYQAFKGRWGGNGGLYSYNDYLGYWDSCKDTIYKITADFNSKSIGIFSFGQYQFPRNDAAYNLNVYEKNRNQYIQSRLFFETENFFVFKYNFKSAQHLVIIDKIEGKSKSVILQNEGGVINNLDNGLSPNPDTYFKDTNGDEYIVSVILPFELKAHVASEAFKNSTPKFPEKKKELEKLANSLNENDNPVLMLVKLKE